MRSQEIPPAEERSAGVVESSSTAPQVESKVVPLAGGVQATFDQDEHGKWILHANGTYTGDGAHVQSAFLYGADAHGMLLNILDVDVSSLSLASPFKVTQPIPKPDPDWIEMGFGIRLADSSGSTTQVVSTPFPVLWTNPVLIDHAVNGSTVSAPNFDTGGVPPGIGIPHTLINSLPEGDYYATVFFTGAGCPSNNFEINAFRPNASWYYDVGGPPFAKAFSSSGGGCMQKFHIDPNKGGDWLWGALSNTGTSSSIADASGIPAFAICATAAACDPILPHAATTPPSDVTSSSTASSTHTVSNVLFLPGIKGSELYENNPLCLIPDDSCGIPLWPPLTNALVPELFLNADGTSRKDIFVRDGGILSNALGESFYDSFVSQLHSLQTSNVFGTGWNWKTVAYDWRLSLPALIQNGLTSGTKTYFSESTDTPYIERQLRALASSSPTGKVTIIAHSNGGLVAKALMETLGDTLAAQLIDSVIFVGVPQSGAPRALGALLYGEDESLPGMTKVPDFMMSAAHARAFALNAPMAYHLLPSAHYLSVVRPDHPLIRFEGGSLLEKARDAYGSTISTEEGMRRFVLASGKDRNMPATDDLASPNILNASLLDYAQEQHAKLDVWQPPPGIEVYQLGGYDVDTISGIDLYAAAHKNNMSTLSYRPLFTHDGDGTVPLTSALMMNGAAHVHQVWLDLPNMRNGKDSYSHANMLEAPAVEETVKDILLGSTDFPYTAHAMDVPEPPTPLKRLAFYVHSPASLTITSERNEITSVSRNGTIQDIPGSTAGIFGDVKYVIVPEDGTSYALSLHGEGSGTFSLDLQELSGDDITASSTIADVPVTSDTSTILTVRTSLASTGPLAVDEDGNGLTDFTITPILGTTTFPDTPPDISSGTSNWGQSSIAARQRQSAVTILNQSLTTVSTSTQQAPLNKEVVGEQSLRLHATDQRQVESTVISKAKSAIPHSLRLQQDPLLLRIWKLIVRCASAVWRVLKS